MRVIIGDHSQRPNMVLPLEFHKSSCFGGRVHTQLFALHRPRVWMQVYLARKPILHSYPQAHTKFILPSIKILLITSQYYMQYHTFLRGQKDSFLVVLWVRARNLVDIKPCPHITPIYGLLSLALPLRHLCSLHSPTPHSPAPNSQSSDSVLRR